MVSGTETGYFSVAITGLTANTTYYARAYAINAAGVAYGNQVSFTTLLGNNWIEITDFAGRIRAGAVGFSIGNKDYVGTEWWGI